MAKSFNKDKLITISILPTLWLLYFSFEIVTGRVSDLYTLTLNLCLTFLFAFVGWLIYKISTISSNGYSNKCIFIIFTFAMLLDQGIKIIIKQNFFNNYFDIIPNFLSFNPIINREGSWLNARFNFNVSFSILIVINVIALLIFLEVYRYLLSNGHKNFWTDMAFVFITAGALCSLIDKVFYGGSLDFIGISDLFIADIKDIYINLGLLFFIMSTYKNDFLDDNTTFKDDLLIIKNFFIFVKKDLFSLIKKEKV